MDQLFRGSNRKSAINNLSRQSSLQIWMAQRQKSSRVSGREPSFLHKLLKIVRQAKQT